MPGGLYVRLCHAFLVTFIFNLLCVRKSSHSIRMSEQYGEQMY